MPAGGAHKGAWGAHERPSDHAADSVVAPHDVARLGAQCVQPGLIEHIVVRCDLHHRVGRGVEDQFPGAQVVLAIVLEHLGAAVGPVAAEARTCRVLELRHHLVRETVGVGRKRDLRNHTHQLPVPGDGFLARAERRQAPIEHRIRDRRNAA